MKTSKQTWLGRLIPSTFYFLLLIISAGCDTNSEMVIDSIEKITVNTSDGPITILAKIDTGAKSSSIDATFAEEHGLMEYVEDTGATECPYGQEYVSNAHGGQCRKRVVFSFNLRGSLHESRATVTNRSHLSTVALIGKADIIGKYLVRPINIEGIQDDTEAEEEKN